MNSPKIAAITESITGSTTFRTISLVVGRLSGPRGALGDLVEVGGGPVLGPFDGCATTVGRGLGQRHSLLAVLSCLPTLLGQLISWLIEHSLFIRSPSRNLSGQKQ